MKRYRQEASYSLAIDQRHAENWSSQFVRRSEIFYRSRSAQLCCVRAQAAEIEPLRSAASAVTPARHSVAICSPWHEFIYNNKLGSFERRCYSNSILP